MKKLTLAILFMSPLSFGQFFENPEESEDFSYYEQNSEPDQGMDSTDPHPDDDDPFPAPINDWLFLLPLAALAIGSHRLLRNKKERI
jgi:hypothetical protein